MNELERYLAEEIALDHRDGHLTRREALRRLAALGLGGASAAALLTACGSTGGPSSASAQSSASSSSSSAELPPSSPTEEIRWSGPTGDLMGAWVAAPQPRGAVLVIHENKGLNDHTRHVAGRFAHRGYSALAIDLLSTEGGTAAFTDPAEATAALGKAPPERHTAQLKSGLDELARRSPGVKLAAIGFCFGGGLTWRLIGVKDERLAAAAPFYGPFFDGADFVGAKTAVLGVYADDDDRVNKTRDAAKSALEAAKLTYELVSYPGQHAFFNDTRERYNAQSAKVAWDKVLAWFGAHVG
ncbi:MAG: dienelactone hydrolase family protein [Polyangiaceae bacterium]